MKRVLVVRLDSEGDVLLAGPAIRAVAAGADHVTLLCGPRGRQAAALLPGVDDIVEFDAAWIAPQWHPVDQHAVSELIARLRAAAVDEALILTSYHQSALPTALLLRLAGVPVIAAISEDYPGSLLDVRHHVDDDIHEVTRNLSLAATLGYHLLAGDHGRLRIGPVTAGRVPLSSEPYVVVHPGASVPARAWRPDRHAELVSALLEHGWQVAVTGATSERGLTARVAVDGAWDLGGTTTFGELAEVIAAAEVIVVGNTGPAHLAAAVGTPVVSLYAPTVPAVRWHPWMVEHQLLGVDVPCAGCRARDCPVAGHPCLDVPVADVLGAVERLADRMSRALSVAAPMEMP